MAFSPSHQDLHKFHMNLTSAKIRIVGLSDSEDLGITAWFS